MSITIDESGRRIYPWWLSVVITTIVALLLVPAILGLAFLYLKYWHPSFLMFLNNNFGLYPKESLEAYTSFNFDKLMDHTITVISNILYNLLIVVSSIFIGIKRKRAYSDFMLPTFRQQLLERSGKIGREYEELSGKKVKLAALKDLLELTEDEAVTIMDIRKTTKAASLKKIYAISQDANAFNCCMEQIFDSAVKEDCEYLKISGIAQYEFIGKFRRYFNSRDGTIDKYGLAQSPFLHLLEVKKKIDFKILLLDPNSSNSNKIIRKRIDSIKSLRPITLKEYKKDIDDTIVFLEYLKNDLKKFDRFKDKDIKISYRLFDDDPIFRYYITDDTLFLSQYVEGDHGHKAMVFEIDKSNKSLHYSFSKLFAKRWRKFK